MHAAITRTTIGAAALAAAGLVVALPEHATPAPAVSRDVALVDIVDDQIATNDNFLNSIIGPGEFEETLYNLFADQDLQVWLGVDGAEPPYSGIFNGAVSRYAEAQYLGNTIFFYLSNVITGQGGPDNGAADFAAAVNDLPLPLPIGLPEDFTVDPVFPTVDLFQYWGADLFNGFVDLLAYPGVVLEDMFGDMPDMFALF
ncbi:hypothetical protein [Mycobacterium shimoidei]|uniref:Uncharacterized protein n=1 Tax=Mycobacterium shimoidei TaxID=29313 RepID=A0A1E3SZA3_MYCSH|nr:hypothetical protein [Mycobacterium shimoidei]MCV7257036.1 hypothetical protein [Mycobacterium shimoidei]ODR07414.1 hypothetical protein BHQ16_21295 [Mycobacterium shimoidei]ORW77094.1 hypothetical protein AWC26_19870 [Mycobacterium shimoidei]SRX95760.1 hypothetical protein MSP7336_04033 [Mycobacterium shimoidei]